MSVFCRTSEENVDPYEGISMLTVRATTEDGLMRLRELYTREGVDMWTPPARVDQDIPMLLTRESHGHLSSVVNSNVRHAGIEIVKRHDIGRIIEEGMKSQKQLLDRRRSLSKGQSLPDSFDLTEYHTYSEIMDYIDSLDSVCARCEVEIIGETYEGRKLKLIKINGLSEGYRPKFWIDAGVHAREWIAPATALNFIDQLVNLQKADLETRLILGAFDWYILPLANPDGYEYTWTANRYWRKNRSQNPNYPDCPGADLNRNFEYKWMEVGASSRACSQIYGGISPLSELETQAITRYLRKEREDLIGYMSLHAYGLMWLLPWSFSKVEEPEGIDDMMDVGISVAEAIKDFNGHNYTVGSPAKILYPVGGCSFDWTLNELGIKYSVGLELQPDDASGFNFTLPAEMIQGQGREFTVAMTVACDTILTQLSER